LKVDRLVDICNGTIKNKKGVKKGCENIDRPDHPLLKEALEVLVMFAEWKKEAGKETSAFITNQSYEDLCWLVCCLVGVSQTYLRPDQKNILVQRRLGTDDIEHIFAYFRMRKAAYLIECNVTGSDEGTSDKPKFSLMSLFRDHVFPKVLDLVSKGGEFEDYLPVFQGDNAGPHIDATYHNFVKEHCEKTGWRWEPQAPQMPHMNNLDLAVFPKMSKDHSRLLQNYSNKMAPPEAIWKTAESVWRHMDSASIAKGFVLAYRIAQKVIDNGGTNTFLQTHDFHSGVRADFLDTDDGVQKKVRVIE
jgi:hypothetical protein